MKGLYFPLMWLLASLSFPLNALTVAEVDLPDTLAASNERPELHLNGAGLRELYALVKSYIGALYLEKPSQNAEEILQSESHQRMVFHVMLKSVSSRRIAKVLQEALILNVSSAEHNQLAPRLAQMMSYFDGKMKRGEQAIFDYIPGKGTRITVAGEEKGIIEGRDYFRAMLAIWLGDQPVSRELKEQVLGRIDQNGTTLAVNH